MGEKYGGEVKSCSSAGGGSFGDGFGFGVGWSLSSLLIVVCSFSADLNSASLDAAAAIAAADPPTFEFAA